MPHLADIFADYQSLPEYSGLLLDNISGRSLFGDYPINVAATRGAIDELSTLYANGANLDEAGEHGYSPLHNAVEQGHVDAVCWLLERGANWLNRNMRGETPFDLAVLLDEHEILNILVTHVESRPLGPG